MELEPLVKRALPVKRAPLVKRALLAKRALPVERGPLAKQALLAKRALLGILDLQVFPVTQAKPDPLELPVLRDLRGLPVLQAQWDLQDPLGLLGQQV